MLAELKRFMRDDSGATAVEYGLIASLVSISIISAATRLGTNTSNTFNTVSRNLK